jgi:hypothetical protein
MTQTTHERAAKSHVTVWLLAVVAVPVLYVLTFPMVVWVVFTFQRATFSHSSPPPWFRAYATPYGWLRETPAGGLLDDYFKWVQQHLP